MRTMKGRGVEGLPVFAGAAVCPGEIPEPRSPVLPPGKSPTLKKRRRPSDIGAFPLGKEPYGLEPRPSQGSGQKWITEKWGLENGKKSGNERERNRLQHQKKRPGKRSNAPSL